MNEPLYLGPNERPAPDDFETLFRIMGGRREPRSLLLVAGHLAIKLLADTNPVSP